MDKEEIRRLAENDLRAFVRLIAPEAVLGHVHDEFLDWLQRPDTRTHKLGLLPRDHQKSRMAAFYVLWRIIKNPCIRILYISSTSNLAEKQLKFIKDKLEGKIIKKYWPDLVNADTSKRAKWTNSEIEVDHPLRKKEAVRDPTIFIAGLTTSITGMHCDLSVLDDVIVFENAYTEEGRNKVASQISLLTSIEGTEAEQLVVGTRYHPKDYYGLMIAMEYEDYDEDAEQVKTEKVYDIFQRVVEEDGEFLWPRQQRVSDAKWFGFNANILARKKAQYTDKTQFYAQYYNNPNNPEGSGVDPLKFQYYDRKFVKQEDGKSFLKGKRLNVYAAVDFAFSLNKKADSTTIAVVGIDCDNNYYVLDLDRFKTDKISDYYNHILKLHVKWGFKKIRCEVNVAQVVIVRDLKENYIKKDNLRLSIDEYRPTRNEGSKKERVSAILYPKYDNNQIWHYRGGNCQTLEDELVLENPAHDDCMDALASCIDFAVAPTKDIITKKPSSVVAGHSRFGGY